MHHIRKVILKYLKKHLLGQLCPICLQYSMFCSGLCGFLWSWRLKIWFFTQLEYNGAIVAKENYLLTGGNLEQHSTCCLTWLFFKLAPLWCYCIRRWNIPEIIFHHNSYKWLTARLPMDLDGKKKLLLPNESLRLQLLWFSIKRLSLFFFLIRGFLLLTACLVHVLLQ